MEGANGTDADYLYHKEKIYYNKSLDPGNKIIQLGRVADIFKVWTYLKGNGLKGVEDQIDKKR